MEKLWTLISQVHVNPEGKKLGYLRLFYWKKKEIEMTVLIQAARNVLEQKKGLKWS